jgi:hypothetical protein
MKGIAKVLEQRLHEFGIYTYKQIAVWTEEQIKEFSSRLAFKDRIHREKWVEQAQKLLSGKTAAFMIHSFAVSLLLFLAILTHAAAEAVPVIIVPGKGITRGGEPYFVKGAGGEKHLDELAAAGGNSIRTWTTNGLEPILDTAQQRGLTVCAGIWLEPECNWFSYANSRSTARSRSPAS